MRHLKVPEVFRGQSCACSIPLATSAWTQHVLLQKQMPRLCSSLGCCFFHTAMLRDALLNELLWLCWKMAVQQNSRHPWQQGHGHCCTSLFNPVWSGGDFLWTIFQLKRQKILRLRKSKAKKSPTSSESDSCQVESPSKVDPQRKSRCHSTIVVGDFFHSFCK